MKNLCKLRAQGTFPLPSCGSWQDSQISLCPVSGIALAVGSFDRLKIQAAKLMPFGRGSLSRSHFRVTFTFVYSVFVFVCGAIFY